MKNTSLCYIEKDGCLLLLHKNKKADGNFGKWVGIGGKFEEGESPFDCVCREVTEETGLIPNNPQYRAVITFVSDEWESEQMHLFSCSDFCGTLAECDEGELCWVEKEKVLTLPHWEGDRIFLDLLLKGAPFFSLKLCYKGEKLVSHILKTVGE